MSAQTQLAATTSLGRHVRMIIDGEEVDASGGETFAALNPATGETLANVAQGAGRDVDRAVSAARRAFEGPWRRTTPVDRQRMLQHLGELVATHVEELAKLDSMNVGLPIARSVAAVETAAKSLFAYAAAARTIRGATIENSVGPEMLSYTRKEPVGVVAAITPWNSPITTAVGKIGPALAAGCTLILKPAEQSPLSAVRLGQLCLEAGIPNGVVNVVPGFGETGAALAEHLGVDKVSFTGSIKTGQSIIRASAVNMKRLTLELGGKSPDVVFADADMDKAVPGAAMAAFTLTGQFCAAGSRLLVERSIYEEFVGRVVDFGQSLIVGDPLSNATDLGPVVSQEQLDTVLRYVEIGRGEGARLRVGGERLTADRFGAGFFLPPTVFTEVDNDMQISQNEIFGPVLAAMPFDSIEEAISLANSTTYGLASGVWTSDVRKAHHMAAALEAGMVWINTYGNYDKAVPFGGFKMSGIGVENGPEGLEQYLRSKAVWLDTAA
jgi:aldehyde dehydrogenase (NAD+)